MQTILLNDGTEVAGHILDGDDGSMIFVYLDNMSVVEGVMLFADSEKSRHIVALSYGHEHIYDGYTELYSASHAYGNCNLVMKRG